MHALASDDQNGEQGDCNGTSVARVRAIPESRVPPEGVGAIVSGWSGLRFGYTCRNSVSGTFWSATDKEFQVISMLPQFSGLCKVTLVECDDVVDLSPLSAVRSVALNRCNGVTDVRPLQAARVLNLEWCLNVMHLGGLPILHELTVDRCPKLSNLTGLGSCPELQVLSLRKCRNIRSLGGLEALNLRTLRLEQLHNVSDLSPAIRVEKLVCRDLPAVRDATAVMDVPDLRFQKCRNIRLPVDLGLLPNVQLEDCGLSHPLSRDEFDKSPQLESQNDTGSSVSGEIEPSIASTDSQSVYTDLDVTLMPDSDNERIPESTIASDGSVRVRADSKDWVAEARELQEKRNRQQLAEQQALQARLEEIDRERRLQEFERLDAERQERELREAEERFVFEETHIKAAERRRANAVQRVEQQAAAEAAARESVEKTAAALRDKQRKMTDDREQRKARVKAMLKRVKATDAQ